MNQEKLLNIIARALDISHVNIDSNQDNLDVWDSLGHLSILSTLDEEFKGKTTQLSNLARATSVKEIYTELSKANLVD